MFIRSLPLWLLQRSRRPDCVLFNDTATTQIYTLSLHDALPISFVDEHCAFAVPANAGLRRVIAFQNWAGIDITFLERDRKSTRLNSSHRCISYAVFCLKKKRG